MKAYLRKALVWMLCLVMCLTMSTGLVFATDDQADAASSDTSTTTETVEEPTAEEAVTGGSLDIILGDGASITVDAATIKSASSVTTDEENPWTNAKGNKYVGTFYKLADILTTAGVENISDAHGITTVASDGFTNGFAQSDLDNIYIYDMGEVLRNGKPAGDAGKYATALNGGQGNKWANDIVTVKVVESHVWFIKKNACMHYCSICGADESSITVGESKIYDCQIKAATSVEATEAEPWTNAKGAKYVGKFYKLTDILTSAGVENISDAHGIITVASDGFTNGFAQSDLDNLYIYDMGEVLKNGKAAGNAGTYGTALNGGAGNKWANDIITVKIANDHQAFVKNGVEYSYCSICGEEISAKPEAEVFRIYGDSRYTTAFKNADKLKELQNVSKFDAVVVTTGENYPDALSGSYFASKNNAPLLLIDKSSAESVRDYIKNNVNANGKIIVLGGESAVPEAWLYGLDGYTIDRIAGATRYVTNLEILEASGYIGGNILVATASNYADSLSGSSLDMPILLVNGKGSLTKDQTAFLTGKNAQIYIAGGTGAVSKQMETSLATYGKVVKRFAGNTRYETSSLMAEEFFPAAKSAVLTVGDNFPDGLSAGPVAAKLGAPLLLTNNDSYNDAAKYAKNHNINSGIVIGGAGDKLISDDTAKAVFSVDKIGNYGE